LAVRQLLRYLRPTVAGPPPVAEEIAA
jgi:hypothetical protein